MLLKMLSTERSVSHNTCVDRFILHVTLRSAGDEMRDALWNPVSLIWWCFFFAVVVSALGVVFVRNKVEENNDWISVLFFADVLRANVGACHVWVHPYFYVFILRHMCHSIDCLSSCVSSVLPEYAKPSIRESSAVSSVLIAPLTLSVCSHSLWLQCSISFPQRGPFWYNSLIEVLISRCSLHR